MITIRLPKAAPRGLLLALLLGSSGALHADSITTYVYVGYEYSGLVYSGDYSYGEVSDLGFEFTLSAPLADSFSGDVTPLYFFATGEPTVVTQASADLDSAGTLFHVTTDAFGDPIAYDIVFETENLAAGTLTFSQAESDMNGRFFELATCLDVNNTCGTILGEEYQPYTRQTVPVLQVLSPEPATLPLVLSGALFMLAGLNLTRRQRVPRLQGLGRSRPSFSGIALRQPVLIGRAARHSQRRPNEPFYFLPAI